MLEHETSDILHALTERSIGMREAISLGEVLSSNLPRGVKAYLRAEVHQWLLDDLARAPRFSRIQSASPAGTRQLDVFVRSMAEHYVFMRLEFLATLEHAVLFTLNYLCRPHRTLSSFLFSSTSTIATDVLRRKMRYVADYQYLFSVLDRVIAQRRLKEIDETELRGLLVDIDKRVVKEHTSRELASLAKPIFDFLLLSNATRDASIPLRPVLAFFEDKGMAEVADFIDKVCHVRSRTDISLKGLSEILEDLIGPSPVKAPHPPPLPEPAGRMEDASPVAPGAAPPVVEQTSPEPQAPPATELSSSSAEQAIAPLPPPQPENEPAFDDIRTIITPDQRQRFIRTICGKDEAFYEALMVKFNGMREWGDASEYLRDIFAIHGIDPFSAVAVELTDVIQQRFSDVGRGDQ